MITGISDFFNSDNFMPHGHCFLWQSDILWLHVLSDAGIALAYFSIPFALIYFVYKRKDLPFQGVFLLFGAFILLCGSTHLLSIWVLWHPDYAAEGVVKAMTAIVSITTFFMLVKLIPKALSLPSPSELTFLNSALREANKKLEIMYEKQRSSGQAHLRAVVDHAIDGLITINERGIIQSFNPACERIFGYAAGDMLGKNIKSLMPEPYHSEHDGYLLHYLHTGEAKIIGTAGREVRAKRKDGTIFPMDLSVSSFLLDGQQFFSGIIRDITMRKEVEAKLITYMRELESSNKELDDFAYIASHDLKEPLRGIHNHSRFLLEDNQDKLDAESVGRLGRLIYLSQRMEKLVNDLLYFSRLGRQELAIQPTDINLVIKDIESTLDILVEEHHVQIIIHGILPTITCDRLRVTEIFRNLITNAVKYNDKPEKVIEIGFLPEFGEFSDVFYVKDNGIGIPEEFYSEIFRIFKRLQSSKTQEEEGTGVGLTFIKKIIERHGGTIWLHSEIGQGTCFYFTLKEPTYDTHG